MNRSDDEPASIEHRGCYERAAAGPQVPRKTGVVVTSLAGGPAAAEAASAWSLVFDGFDQASEGIREALCTLGNGYFANRAAASWAVADGAHYPGVEATARREKISMRRRFHYPWRARPMRKLPGNWGSPEAPSSNI